MKNKNKKYHHSIILTLVILAFSLLMGSSQTPPQKPKAASVPIQPVAAPKPVVIPPKAVTPPKKAPTPKPMPIVIPQPIPDFQQIPTTTERKTVFFNYLAPLIEQNNQAILKLRQAVQLKAKKPQKYQAWLNQVAEKYNVSPFDPEQAKDIEALLQKINIIPPSLALAQAANESAWGTSRFALQAHNYFGQWCFKKGCGLVPKRRQPGAINEVRKFESPSDSVKSYLHNLNSHQSYAQLRHIRSWLIQNQQPITGLALANGLTPYSARKIEYVKEIKAMIRYNKLQKYDLKGI